LREAREKPEGKNLASVGVPRDLKVDAVRARFIEVHRLVGEEDDRLGRVAPFHCAGHVRAVPIAELVRRPVVDAGEVDRLSVLHELHVLVA
jgi:hypothetical protein